VFYGNGDGTFGARTDVAAGSYPNSIAIGDYNGDGRADLATANYGANTVSVLLANVQGSLGPKSDFGTGNGPYSIATGDFNGDGMIDLVTANGSANTVSVLFNNIQEAVSVEPERASMHLELSPPHPNPFRSGVLLGFALPTSAPVRLGIYDLEGRQVASLQDGILQAGRHQRSWDGMTAGGSASPTGVYLVRFSTPGFVRTMKVILVR
jgi:hypothetical protein